MPVDPLATDQIEVIRGPATLRYGSQSIGGVVSATNNRIPEALPCAPRRRRCPASSRQPCRLHPAAPPSSCAARCRASTTASKAARCSTPAPAISRFMPTFRPQTDDYRVPPYPYLFAPDPAELPLRRSRAASTAGSRIRATRSHEASVGGSYLFHRRLCRRRPIRATPRSTPSRASTAKDHRTRIDARQDQADRARAKYRPRRGGDRRHPLLVRASPTTSTTKSDLPTPPTRAATASARPSPTRSRKAASRSSSRRSTCGSPTLTTAIGVQAAHQELTAPGDDPTSPVNGLFDPNRTTGRRRLHVQRIQVQRHDQGADRRPHRAGQPERHRDRLPRRRPCSTSRPTR